MEELHQYYEILGLTPAASPEEVKQAYRDLVKIWHPDRFSNDERLQQKAQEKLKEINDAYERLKSRQQRASRPAPQAKPPGRPSKPRAPKTISRKQKSHSSQPSKARRIPVRIAQALAASAAAFSLFVLVKYFASALLPTPHPANLISYSTQEQESQDTAQSGAPTDHETDTSSDQTKEGAPGKVLVMEKQIYMPPALPLSYFSLGSTREQVIAIQGAADRSTSDSLQYGTSEVIFQNSQVVGWDNSYPRLKVRMLPTTPINTTYFTISSSKDEVLAVQGTPDRFTANSFHYGSSEVVFQNGGVVSWKNKYPRLKVQMLPATPTTMSHFTFGSTKDEVLAAQGTPDRFTGNAFHYGTSEVIFQNDRVVSWNNSYPRLKVRMSPEG